MKENYESKIKLTVPGEGTIEIHGTSAFVHKFLGTVRVEFMERLTETVKSFKGSLEMVETRDGNDISIDIAGTPSNDPEPHQAEPEPVEEQESAEYEPDQRATPARRFKPRGY